MALPYIQLPSLPLPFGLELHAFGVLAALGIWVGARLAAKASLEYAPGDDGPLVEVAPWAVGGGLVGGRLMHVFAYHPEEIGKYGFFDAVIGTKGGLSSMGGVLGALLAIALWFKLKKLPLMKYWDAFALGTAPGWAVARVGCFLAHDHPGVKTDFPLAVAYPDGPRHDLGLYDAVVLGVIAAVLWALARKRRPEGLMMGILAVAYASSRFLLDFLRASDRSYVDARYLGLTPAQYVVVGIFGIGVFLLVRAQRLSKLPAPPTPPAPPARPSAA